MTKLPAFCATRLPSTGEPILIKAGVEGYWPAPDINPELLNATFGITEAQRKAMEVGSMFGWDAKGADPDYYLNGESS